MGQLDLAKAQRSPSASFAALGVCSVGWNGVMLGETARFSPPGQVGIMTSAVLMFAFSGVVLGPTAFGFAANLGGSFATAYAVFGTLALIGGVPVLLMVRRT